MTAQNLLQQVATPRVSSVTERWQMIPGSEGLYSVSTRGRIRSHFKETPRILKPNYDTKGYQQFAMFLPGGRRKQMKVHRAVALTFLGPRPPGAQINHISGDKLDNSVANLEYVSCRQNIRHAWAMGLRRADQVQGERHGMAKLTADNVREIRLIGDSRSLSEISQTFFWRNTAMYCFDTQKQDVATRPLKGKNKHDRNIRSQR
jgi:hypothetical protein